MKGNYELHEFKVFWMTNGGSFVKTATKLLNSFCDKEKSV